VETKWLRSGEAVGAGAKVYGFRVDNVHNETYRMLNGMHRNAVNGEEEIELVGGVPDDDSDGGDGQNGENRNQESAEKKKRKLKIKFSDKDGQKTLESVKAITLSSFETQFDADPLFRKTTQKFDESRIGSLMSSTLNCNSDLLIQLDSKMANVAST